MGMSSGISVRCIMRADAVHAVAAEEPHEVVFEREVELRERPGRPGGRHDHAAGCRCAATRAAPCRGWRDRRPRRPATCSARRRSRLASASASSFCSSVASSGSMPRSRRMSSPEDLRIAAQDDVGASAGHVRRDGDRARAAGLRDDVRFLLVELGVEHVVLDAALRRAGARASRSSRWRWCRRGTAGRPRGARRSRRPPRRTWRRPCGRSGRSRSSRIMGWLVGTTMTGSL